MSVVPPAVLVGAVGGTAMRRLLITVIGVLALIGGATTYVGSARDGGATENAMSVIVDQTLPLDGSTLFFRKVTVFNALLPVLVVGEWHRGAAVVGIVDALGGAGFLLAAMAYRRTAIRFGDLRVAIVGFVACNALLVLQPWFGVSVLMGLVLVGAFVFGQARIATRSLLMTSVEESRVGHAFGVANGYGLAATVAVMLVASVVTGRTDTRYGFATLVVISLAAAVLAAVWIRRSTFHRRTESHEHEAGTVSTACSGIGQV